MPRFLVLDASLSRSLAAIVSDDHVTAQRTEPSGRGHSVQMAPMVAAVLDEAGIDAASLDGVAVTTGPGSFTGLRASLALGHGIAWAAGRPIIGVTVAEVFSAAISACGGRLLRTAIDNRRGRLFVADGNGPFTAFHIDELQPAAERMAIAGDAAVAVTAILAARGGDVLLTNLRLAAPLDIARAAARRLAGVLTPLSALPLYVDPPEARLPAGGLRPPPSG